MTPESNNKQIMPDLIRRTTGGWLAVSPSNCRISVGVTASTQDEAIDGFRFMFSRWLEILALK